MKTKLTALTCLVLVLTIIIPGSAQADEWNKLSKNLKKAVTSGNGNLIAKALVPILTLGGKKSVKVMVDVIRRIPESQNLIYWQLINGVCTVTDDQAMDELAQVIIKAKKTALSRDIVFGLQTNKCSSVYRLYEKVLCGGPPDVQGMVIDLLINNDEPNIGTPVLVAGLKKVKNKFVRAKILDALHYLTGANPGDDYKDWEKWWAVVKEDGGIKKIESGPKKGGTGTVVDELERSRRRHFEGERRKIKVLVIFAECHGGNRTHMVCFDHIEYMTRRMKIDTTVIERKEFEKSTYKIPKGITAVIIDCVQMKPHCICPNCKQGKVRADRMYP